MSGARPARWLASALAGAGILALVALAVTRLDTSFLGVTDLVAALAVLFAWCAVPAAFVAGRRSRVDEAKLSSDLDAVSRRLLRLEAGGVAPAPASPIEEIVEDIGSLSRVVKDLAETAAGHERAIAALGTARPGEPAPDAHPSAVPPPVVPSFFPVREPSPDLPAVAAAPSPAKPTHAAILDALDAGRLDLHVQPIVSLPQRHPRYYETFALLTSDTGDAFVPAEFLPALERLGKLPRLDGLVISRAFEVASRARSGRRKIPISCNLSAASLADPAFVEILGQIVDDTADDATLVLEMAQRTWLATEPKVLARLQGAGLAFALDAIEQFDLDADELVSAGVRYVKIPAGTIMDAQARPPGSGRNVAQSPELLAGSGLQLVASLVEDDSVVPELIELRIPLAQGYAFALPSPVASVFAPGGPEDAILAPDGFADGNPEATPPRPESRSFREFLRRAG